jgi:hypothetical protein
MSMVLGVVLATVAALTFTAPAHADFRFFQQVRTQKNEGFCIGISGASTASGAPAGLFHCDPGGGGGNQLYQFFGGISDATMVANHSRGCLRIRGNSFANGAQVVQGSCGSVSAHWQLTNLREGSTSRLASIRNRLTGKCIGYPGGVVFNGADIQVFNCDNAPFGNQNWAVNEFRSQMPG